MFSIKEGVTAYCDEFAIDTALNAASAKIRDCFRRGIATAQSARFGGIDDGFGEWVGAALLNSRSQRQDIIAVFAVLAAGAIHRASDGQGRFATCECTGFVEGNCFDAA